MFVLGKKMCLLPIIETPILPTTTKKLKKGLVEWLKW
jgi:hypothetical protein